MATTGTTPEAPKHWFITTRYQEVGKMFTSTFFIQGSIIEWILKESSLSGREHILLNHLEITKAEYRRLFKYYEIKHDVDPENSQA